MESQYFQLLDEPIDLTNKAEVDEKCNPEKLFKEMGRRINQTQVYYKGLFSNRSVTYFSLKSGASSLCRIRTSDHQEDATHFN